MTQYPSPPLMLHSPYWGELPWLLPSCLSAFSTSTETSQQRFGPLTPKLFLAHRKSALGAYWIIVQLSKSSLPSELHVTSYSVWMSPRHFKLSPIHAELTMYIGTCFSSKTLQLISLTNQSELFEQGLPNSSDLQNTSYVQDIELLYVPHERTLTIWDQYNV